MEAKQFKLCNIGQERIGKSALSERRNDKWIFLICLATGIVAHGFVMSNKFIYMDEVYYYNGLGSTFSSNRWVLGLAYSLGNDFFDFFSSSWFNGLLAIVFVAFAAILLCRMLRLKTKMATGLLAVLMVAFPVMASIFICMFTAPMYQIALFLSLLSVYVLREPKTLSAAGIAGRVLLASLLLAISLGIYQAYITVAACTAWLLLMSGVLRGESIARTARHGLLLLVMGILGLAEYLVINKIFIRLIGVQTLNYKGMDTMGRIAFEKLPGLIRATYRDFFVDYCWNGINAFPIIVLSLAFMAVAGIVLFFIGTQDIATVNRWVFVGMTLAFPLFANGAFLLSTDEDYRVTTLMQYALVTVFAIPLLILEHVAQPGEKNRVNDGCGRAENKARTVAATAIILSFAVCLCGYTYQDNACYTKAAYITKQADAYYTQLITRIRQTEGYRDEYPVAFVGSFAIEDSSIYVDPALQGLRITGYDMASLKAMLSYRPLEYMKINCGYAPQLVEDTSALLQDEEIQSMPSYPDDGSIQVIDETVVIKLNTGE